MLVHDPEEQRIVGRILRLAERGWRDHRIAKAMRAGARNPRRGGEWSRGTVSSILATAGRTGTGSVATGA